MRAGIRRFVFGACLVMGLIASTAPSASAQVADTDRTSPLLTAVSVEAAALSAERNALPTPPFRPKLNASFRQQQAASTANEGIGVGVLAMLTRASLSGDDVFDIGNRTGYGFGLWVGGNRNGRVGFVGEFIYLIRDSDDYKDRALEIPAVFHINFGSRSRNSAGGYVVLGPVFTINLQQELFGTDLSDNFNGADIGLIGGVGVEVYRVGIEVRGNWGFRNINTEGDIVDTKNRSFEILGKFAFN
jgi:hypothetical protein